VKEAPFLNSHCLTIDCSVLLEAGPLVQSSLTKDWEPELDILKWPSTNEIDVACINDVSVPTSIPLNGKLPWSVAQEKVPEVLFHNNLSAIVAEQPVVPVIPAKAVPKNLEAEA
jgi:hypothetical protein